MKLMVWHRRASPDLPRSLFVLPCPVSNKVPRKKPDMTVIAAIRTKKQHKGRTKWKRGGLSRSKRLGQRVITQNGNELCKHKHKHKAG